MRIGIAQINTTPGAFDETVRHMVTQSQRAAEQGVDLLVFPLAALAGVDVLPYADRFPFLCDVAEALVRLSEQLVCPALVPVPLDMGDGESSFDVMLIIGDEVRSLYLSHYGPVPDDTKPREETKGLVSFEFDGSRLALAISYDELDAWCQQASGVDGAIFISPYPFALDDSSSVLAADLEAGRYVADVQTMGVWLACVGSVGGYGDQVFSGSSVVLSPTGEALATAPAFEEALISTVVGDQLPEETHRVPYDVYDAPFHLWQAVSLGIHDYVTKQGKSDVALLLDGSLGSQVLAALATDALGPLHVHALVGASAGPRAAACRQLVRRLRIDHEDASPAPSGFAPRDIDELALAQLGCTHDAVVLSSTDKTELALGIRHSSVQAAALCPLGDVYRSDVLDMAHVRNTISPLFRHVTFDETDAFELPLPTGGVRRIADERDVTAVDEILLNYVEYDQPLASIAAGEGVDSNLVQAVLAAEHAAEPMRRAMPPVLATSTHTLDDARFPLGVRWSDEHMDDEGETELVGSLFSEAEVSPSAEADEPGDEQRGSGEIDLDATLSMLRDFAEQGGFVPQELLQAQLGGPDGEPGEGSSPLAWFTPFSEN